MTHSKCDLANLKPRLNAWDEPIELLPDYVRRVQKQLPNFPEVIIAQWFYEHEHCIEEHAWLDYTSLSFRLEKFTVADLRLPCLYDHETVVQYRNYFLEGTETVRMNRLAEYIPTNGTWPVSPIIFDNADETFISPWEFRYSSPYHLIAGHHRMAVLYALDQHKQGEHTVWLVRRFVRFVVPG